MNVKKKSMGHAAVNDELSGSQFRMVYRNLPSTVREERNLIGGQWNAFMNKEAGRGSAE
jgi:hypothetical protein